MIGKNGGIQHNILNPAHVELGTLSISYTESTIATNLTCGIAATCHALWNV